MKIAMRPATDDDMEFARDCHHRGYRDVVERQFGLWDQEFQDGLFERDWRSATHEILLAGGESGESCGYVSVEHTAEETHVREIVVLPEFQGRGVATAFLREVMADARSGGVPLRLGVLHENRAFELYSRLGFSECGRTETHVLMVWGEGAYGYH